MPNAWPGTRYNLPLESGDMILVGAGPKRSDPIEIDNLDTLKYLVFECKSIDDDKAAVFEYMEAK